MGAKRRRRGRSGTAAKENTLLDARMEDVRRMTGAPLQSELLDQLLDRELVVRRDGFQDATEKGSRFQRAVIRHRDVMRAVDARGEPDVRAVLPHAFVAKDAQRSRKICTIDIPWNLHTASASSRTKCRRMTEGMSPGTPSPKWQRTASRTISRNSSTVSPCVAIACPSAVAT